MYFEEAIVKTYERSYKNKKVPYNQIHLGKDSKFNKNPEEPDKVAVLKLIEFDKLINNPKLSKYNELEAKYNKLAEEHEAIKQQLEGTKEKNEELSSENKTLKEDKLQLQEDLLNYKNFYEDKVEDLTSEKEDSKKLLASIVTLTNENKELEKENIFLKSRGLFNRIINKQYTKETDVPEIVEAEAKTSEENESTDSSKE